MCVSLTQHLNHAGVRTMPLFRVNPTLTKHWRQTTAPIRNWMHRHSYHAQLDAPYSSFMRITECTVQLSMRLALFCLLGMPNSNFGITVDGLYSKFPVRVVLLGHFQTRRSDMVVVTTSALHGIITSRNRLISSLERHLPNWSYPQYP